MEEGLSVSDRVIMMENGVVAIDAPPSDILNQENDSQSFERVKEFMGRAA